MDVPAGMGIHDPQDWIGWWLRLHPSDLFPGRLSRVALSRLDEASSLDSMGVEILEWFEGEMSFEAQVRFVVEDYPGRGRVFHVLSIRSDGDPIPPARGSVGPLAPEPSRGHDGDVAGISTHVLDTSVGDPAAGVPVALEVAYEGGWAPIGHGVTDPDGRLGDLATELTEGTYRIRFDTATYFAATGKRAFYPEVTVVFEVTEPERHHHVPLLLSPFGYSTYRGS